MSASGRQKNFHCRGSIKLPLSSRCHIALPTLAQGKSETSTQWVQFDRVAPGLAVRRLGNVVRELGQGLGRPDADAARDADPLRDALADPVAARHQITAHRREVDQGLVDAVDLLLESEARGDRNIRLLMSP